VLAKEIDAIDNVPGAGEELLDGFKWEREDMANALLIIEELMNFDTMTKLTAKALKNKI
jgi:hypothetical protein